jgi:hypothetical protein
MNISRCFAAAFGAALSLVARVPDFTPPTPLIGAALRNDTAEVKRLLAAGADPNEGRLIGSPPIFFGLMHFNAEIFEAMVERGADIHAADASGSTTLMWAASHEGADPTLVDRLLSLGADPNAKNKKGETALSWALRRGYTPVVESLKKAGGSDTPLIRQSVEKAIELLQKSGPEFVKVSGCTSCHHQSLPQMAYSTARERGFRVDSQVSQQQVKAVMAMFRPIREQMASGKANLPDPAISVSYSLLGLAAESYAPDATTEAMAHVVALQQTADGSFLALPARPPIESSVFTATALSLRALQFYGRDPEAAVKRAGEWLVTAKPGTTEERAMRLLGLSWANADVDLRSAARELLAEQRPDGGWAQLPGLETDAYATGQALFALHESGQVTSAQPWYRRGVAFLLRTQLEDGSWLVRTRSIPFQPYRESGFPHGKHQWISAAGTSWAVMALSLTQPPIAQLSRTR